MTSKKGMVTVVTIVLASAILVALGLTGNQIINEKFKKALIITGSSATGSALSVGDSEFNIFTGKGRAQKITVEDTSESSSKGVFEATNVVFEVQPLSLIYGVLEVKSVRVGDLNVVAKIAAGQSNMKNILASALAFSKVKGGAYSDAKMNIHQLSILKGTLEANVMILGGKTVARSINLPPVQMTNIANNVDGSSPATIAYEILQELGSSVVNKALTNF